MPDPESRPSSVNVDNRHDMALKDDEFQEVWSPLLNFYRCGSAL